MRVAPGASGLESPFEHRARNVERARDDPVAIAVDVGADVDQDAVLGSGRECLDGFEPGDPCPRRIEQVVERPPPLVERHEQIICPSQRCVQTPAGSAHADASSGSHTGRLSTAPEQSADEAMSSAATRKIGVGLSKTPSSQPEHAVAAAITAYSRTFQSTVKPWRRSGRTRAWAESTTSGHAPVPARAVTSSAPTNTGAVSATLNIEQNAAAPPSRSRIVARCPLVSER